MANLSAELYREIPQKFRAKTKTCFRCCWPQETLWGKCHIFISILLFRRGYLCLTGEVINIKINWRSSVHGSNDSYFGVLGSKLEETFTFTCLPWLYPLPSTTNPLRSTSVSATSLFLIYLMNFTFTIGTSLCEPEAILQ